MSISNPPIILLRLQLPLRMQLPPNTHQLLLLENLQKSSPTLSCHLIGKQCYIEQCHQIKIFCQCRIALDTVCKWTCILMHLCSPAGVRNPSVEHVMLLGAAAISWRLPPSLPSGEDPSLPPSLPPSVRPSQSLSFFLSFSLSRGFLSLMCSEAGLPQSLGPVRPGKLWSRFPVIALRPSLIEFIKQMII